MAANLKQHHHMAPRWLFDPVKGNVVREPLASGEGHWVGAPGVFSDEEAIYLTYRYRQPRDQGRGVESRIARSVDGVHFEDIWHVPQSALETSSVERFALDKTPEGYVLYLSFVDPVDNRWRTDRVIAPRPDQFRVHQREPLFTAAPLNVAAVKDPVLVHAHGLSWMFLSTAVVSLSGLERTEEELHASQDVYTTGLVSSTTGLAVSRDGLHYQWLGHVLEPSPQHWDAYASRISTVFATSHGFIAFYDGGASVQENYEERTGVAVSADLVHWTKLSVDGPWLVSPYGKGTLRYIDYVIWNRQAFLYYEMARPDGSHELRVIVLPQDEKGAQG